jgi:non-specific serine/threonine protein kinase
MERARHVQPSFALTETNVPVIARICRKLDGMPLAIELAAARINLLRAEHIEIRLNDRFQLLTSGQTITPRHQTLRTTLEWSHDLLSEAEQVLFRRLSVFAGGWTLDSANAVCGENGTDVLDILAQLVNKSLVIVEREPEAEARYRMLETIREYAREKLSTSGEREKLRARHFDYFHSMAEQGEPMLFAQESSLDWAESEIDDLRAAFAWSLESDSNDALSQERAGRGLELLLHVWPLWLQRGYSIEGNEWMNQFLSVHTATTLARTRALLLAGDFARYRGDLAEQVRLIQESLVLARELGDKKRIAWSLMEMGLAERDFRRYTEAIQFLTESLAMFQELNENLWVCRTSFLLAETHMANGELEAAKPLWNYGLKLCREENDKWQISWGLEGLGHIERLEGRLEQARELYLESLHLKVSVMDRAGIIYSLEALAQLAAMLNQFERAAVLWGMAEGLRQTFKLQLPPSREELYTSLIPEARAQLGEEVFAAVWSQGQSMEMRQAIDYALTIPDN